jgi:ABC-2 type transport system permease protein
MTARRTYTWTAALIAVTVGLGGCGSTGITAGRLDSSISQTFANLYGVQQQAVGRARTPAASLKTRANCVKGTGGAAQSGAGNDWVCTVHFTVPPIVTPFTAIYNVTVQTDGCYSAEGDGPTAATASRLIRARNGELVPNPLWLINGCFDIT